MEFKSRSGRLRKCSEKIALKIARKAKQKPWDILLVKGRMDLIKYQEILEANITPSEKKLKTKRG